MQTVKETNRRNEMKKSDAKRHANYNKRAALAFASAKGRQKVMALIRRGIQK